MKLIDIEPGIKIDSETFFTVCEGHPVSPLPYPYGSTQPMCMGCMMFGRLKRGQSLRGSSFKVVEAEDFGAIIAGMHIPEEFKPKVLEMVKDWDGFSYGRGDMYGGSTAVVRAVEKGESFTAGSPGYGSWQERLYKVS